MIFNRTDKQYFWVKKIGLFSSVLCGYTIELPIHTLIRFYGEILKIVLQWSQVMRKSVLLHM